MRQPKKDKIQINFMLLREYINVFIFFFLLFVNFIYLF